MAAKQLTPKQALAALKKEERELEQRSGIVVQKIWDLERQIRQESIGDAVGKCFRGAGIKDAYRVLEALPNGYVLAEAVDADLGSIRRFTVSIDWIRYARALSQANYDNLKATAMKKLGMTEAKS